LTLLSFVSGHLEKVKTSSGNTFTATIKYIKNQTFYKGSPSPPPPNWVLIFVLHAILNKKVVKKIWKISNKQKQTVGLLSTQNNRETSISFFRLVKKITHKKFTKKKLILKFKIRFFIFVFWKALSIYQLEKCCLFLKCMFFEWLIITSALWKSNFIIDCVADRQSKVCDVIGFWRLLTTLNNNKVNDLYKQKQNLKHCLFVQNWKSTKWNGTSKQIVEMTNKIFYFKTSIIWVN
jgi:hypothetical protein